MRGVVAAIGLTLALGLTVVMSSGGCDDDLCPNKYGHAYECTCTRRCQGVTETWTTSYSCFTSSDPEGNATSSCGRSCSPEATCSCSCTQGDWCEVDLEDCR